MSDYAELHGNEIAALLIPTTVTLITARLNDEECEQRDRVATIAWVMPVSHEPSLIAVAIRPGGSTARAMAQSGSFIVNVLAATPEAENVAILCGKKHGVADRFAEASITGTPGEKADALCIDQAISWIECEVVEHAVHGDHELFIGRTLCARTRGTLDENDRLVPEPALLMGQRACFGHFEKGNA